jgi:hypothetical protein
VATVAADEDEERLRAEMRRAAAEERFEDAARLRDVLARRRVPPAHPVAAASAAGASGAGLGLRWDWVHSAAAAAEVAEMEEEAASRAEGFEWARCGARDPAPV